MTDLEPVRALLRTGRVAEARELCKSLVDANQDDAAAWHMLGVILDRTGDASGAERAAANAISVSPAVAEFHVTLGVILARTDRHEQAIAEFRRALSLRRDFPEALNNVGVSLSVLGRLEEAADSYRQAIGLNPDNAEAHNNLGDALRRLGRYIESIDESRRAIELNPALASAHGNMGTAYQEIGMIRQAISCLVRRRELTPGSPRANSELLCLFHYCDVVTPEQIAGHHFGWGAARSRAVAGSMLAPTLTLPRSTGRGDKEKRRIRFGYISPDFREHPTACFVEPVLRNHSRAELEVYCYSDVARPDHVTGRMRGVCTAWREIRGLSNEQAAEMVRRDEIDVLIETTGHMAGNRLELYLLRPAPIQVCLPMYPGTTGLPAMDYFITDALVDPPGVEKMYVERLVRIEGLGRCWQPDEKSPETIPLPAETNGGITFGAFNRLSKVTDTMLGCWGKILAAVPNSRLQVLVEGPGGAQTCPSIVERFQRFGLGPDKVRFMGRRPRWQYLEMLAAADICLDTFPYNGCTTTCDSLWMGTPVVTLTGRAHVSRVAYSFLADGGLAELSGESPDEYVRIAVELATNRARLKEVRTGLRKRMGNSRLTDAGPFTREFEAALRRIWIDWCSAAGVDSTPGANNGPGLIS